MTALIGQIDGQWLHQWALSIRSDYGVDPYIYIILVVAFAPLFYYSLFRLAKAVAGGGGRTAGQWALALLVSMAPPYVYVLAFGHGLPWWVYVVLAALLGHGGHTATRQLRLRRA